MIYLMTITHRLRLPIPAESEARETRASQLIYCCRALARQHTILDIHLCPVSLAELCNVDVNRDLFKIWMSVGKPGGHGGVTHQGNENANDVSSQS
jgi:hypothetical protein